MTEQERTEHLRKIGILKADPDANKQSINNPYGTPVLTEQELFSRPWEQPSQADVDEVTAWMEEEERPAPPVIRASTPQEQQVSDFMLYPTRAQIRGDEGELTELATDMSPMQQQMARFRLEGLVDEYGMPTTEGQRLFGAQAASRRAHLATQGVPAEQQLTHVAAQDAIQQSENLTATQKFVLQMALDPMEAADFGIGAAELTTLVKALGRFGKDPAKYLLRTTTEGDPSAGILPELSPDSPLFSILDGIANAPRAVWNALKVTSEDIQDLKQVLQAAIKGTPYQPRPPVKFDIPPVTDADVAADVGRVPKSYPPEEREVLHAIDQGVYDDPVTGEPVFGSLEVNPVSQDQIDAGLRDELGRLLGGRQAHEATDPTIASTRNMHLLEPDDAPSYHAVPEDIPESQPVLRPGRGDVEPTAPRVTETPAEAIQRGRGMMAEASRAGRGAGRDDVDVALYWRGRLLADKHAPPPRAPWQDNWDLTPEQDAFVGRKWEEWKANQNDQHGYGMEALEAKGWVHFARDTDVLRAMDEARIPWDDEWGAPYSRAPRGDGSTAVDTAREALSQQRAAARVRQFTGPETTAVREDWSGVTRDIPEEPLALGRLEPEQGPVRQSDVHPDDVPEGLEGPDWLSRLAEHVPYKRPKASRQEHYSALGRAIEEDPSFPPSGLKAEPPRTEIVKGRPAFYKELPDGRIIDKPALPDKEVTVPGKSLKDVTLAYLKGLKGRTKGKGRLASEVEAVGLEKWLDEAGLSDKPIHQQDLVTFINKAYEGPGGAKPFRHQLPMPREDAAKLRIAGEEVQRLRQRKKDLDRDVGLPAFKRAIDPFIQGRDVVPSGHRSLLPRPPNDLQLPSSSDMDYLWGGTQTDLYGSGSLYLPDRPVLAELADMPSDERLDALARIMSGQRLGSLSDEPIPLFQDPTAAGKQHVQNQIETRGGIWDVPNDKLGSVRGGTRELEETLDSWTKLGSDADPGELTRIYNNIADRESTAGLGFTVGHHLQSIKRTLDDLRPPQREIEEVLNLTVQDAYADYFADGTPDYGRMRGSWSDKLEAQTQIGIIEFPGDGNRLYNSPQYDFIRKIEQEIQDMANRRAWVEQHRGPGVGYSSTLDPVLAADQYKEVIAALDADNPLWREAVINAELQRQYTIEASTLRTLGEMNRRLGTARDNILEVQDVEGALKAVSQRHEKLVTQHGKGGSPTYEIYSLPEAREAEYNIPKNYREVGYVYEPEAGIKKIKQPKHDPLPEGTAFHVRLTDRLDHKKRKVLHQEESQSDFFQQARVRGFTDEENAKLRKTIEARKDSIDKAYVDAAKAEADWKADVKVFDSPAKTVNRWADSVDEWEDMDDFWTDGNAPIHPDHNFNQHLGLTNGWALRDHLSRMGSDWLNTARGRQSGMTSGGQTFYDEFMAMLPEKDEEYVGVFLKNWKEMIEEIDFTEGKRLAQHKTLLSKQKDAMYRQLSDNGHGAMREEWPAKYHRSAEDWLPYSLRDSIRMAYEEGYEGLTFNRADFAEMGVMMPRYGAETFYGHPDRLTVKRDPNTMEPILDKEGNPVLIRSALQKAIEDWLPPGAKLETTKLPAMQEGLKQAPSEIGVDPAQEGEVWFINFDNKAIAEKASEPMRVYSAVPAAAGLEAGRREYEKRKADNKKSIDNPYGGE